jgi:hypothetical protein
MKSNKDADGDGDEVTPVARGIRQLVGQDVTPRACVLDLRTVVTPTISLWVLRSRACLRAGQ